MHALSPPHLRPSPTAVGVLDERALLLTAGSLAQCVGDSRSFDAALHDVGALLQQALNARDFSVRRVTGWQGLSAQWHAWGLAPSAGGDSPLAVEPAIPNAGTAVAPVTLPSVFVAVLRISSDSPVQVAAITVLRGDTPVAVLVLRALARPVAPELLTRLLDLARAQLELVGYREAVREGGAQPPASAPPVAAPVSARARVCDQAEVVGQYMDNLSHEIRTPLNCILGMTELLVGSSLDENQQHFAQSAYLCGESLLELLNNILDFSALQAGRIELSPTEFNPGGLLEEALAAMGRRAHNKALSLRVDQQPNLPQKVRADSSRLRQVLVSLVSNAIKFTERGEVVVSLRTVSGDEGSNAGVMWLEFSVRDTGIGIAQEGLPRIFEAFVQAKSGMTRPYGGTGLGLAISRQLVEMMGGKMRAHSTLGQGSQFAFTVPVDLVATHAPDKLTPTTRPDSTPSRSNLPYHVLVIDDNVVNRELLGHMLRTANYREYVASSAMAGLRAMCERAFDLVLMDIQMPGMDGIEAMGWLRGGPTHRFNFLTPSDTPVIAVTGHALADDEARFLRMGFDGYLAKPVRQSQLIALLDRNLTRPPQPNSRLPGHERPEGGVAPVPAADVLDREALQRLRALDPAGSNQVMKRVANAFETSIGGLLRQLQSAMEAADSAGIKHVAHTLKSSSASIGATELSKICAEIEAMVLRGQEEGMSEKVATLVAEVPAVLMALQRILDNNA